MTQVTIPPSVGGSGIVYSDDGTGARDLTNGGHRPWFLPLVVEVTAAAVSASESAQDALDAAASTLGAASTQATSTTSLTIGTGSKSLTVETGKNFTVGMPVRIASSASPANRMDGFVTGWTPGTGALVVNVVNTSGSGTLAAWNVMLTGARGMDATLAMPRSRRTSNTQLTTSDSGSIIEITSGTFTQTFAAASVCGAGWFIDWFNTGTGVVTLDPNGSELIDGVTSYPSYPGEGRRITCDGTQFFSSVIVPYSFAFTTVGTSSWTKTPGYRRFRGKVWSGGNSGQKSGSTGTASLGGAGGGMEDFDFAAADLGATENATVGAGGAAVSGTANGNVGSLSSFGPLTVFPGAIWTTGGSAMQGASASAAFARGVEGATPSNGTLNSSSARGGAAPVQTGVSEPGGNSIHGGAAGGSVTAAAAVLAPGTSVNGGDGGAASSTGSGTAGQAPGGGGGATQTGATSGAGARGEVRVEGVV